MVRKDETESTSGTENTSGSGNPRKESATPAEEREGWSVGRAVSGTEGFAHDALRATSNIAGDGVHMARNLATDTVQAVGDVGNEVVRTASNLLVGLVEGLRDVANSMGRRTPPPAP
jgi:hypothetical protein